MSIAYFPGKIGLSVADISTGDYYLTELEDSAKLFDEINKYGPAEIICNDAFLISGMDIEDMRHRLRIAVNALESHYFDEDAAKKLLKKHFKVVALTGLGIEDFPLGVLAAGALLRYLYETQKSSMSNITHIYPYLANTYMLLDSATRRNLELTETLREKQKRGSLLWVLDKTKTAMGARTLRSYIEQPLIDKRQIEERLDAVEELTRDAISRDEIREYLNPVYDLERLLGKISYQSANPRDLIAFRNSLAMMKPIKAVLSAFDKSLLSQIRVDIDPFEDLYELIQAAIEEDPPVLVREGGIIKDGFDDTIDSLRKAKTEGKNWLAALEEPYGY